MGGLIGNVSLKKSGLIPSGYAVYSQNTGGESGDSIILIKLGRDSMPMSMILSAGHPSDGAMILAVTLGVTTGSNFGYPSSLYVHNLAGPGKIVSAIAYHSSSENLNYIEIKTNGLNYTNYSLLGSSHIIREITRTGESMYSSGIHSYNINGNLKNWQ